MLRFDSPVPENILDFWIARVMAMKWTLVITVNRTNISRAEVVKIVVQS